MTTPSILFAVTDPVTALTFLRGQLAYLRAQGFECHLACELTPEVEAFGRREGVVVHHAPLSRNWLSPQDVRTVVRAVRLLRSVRPTVLNYSTPKASAIWALASLFARPRLVVFLLRGLRLDGERPWTPGFALLWLMEFVAAEVSDVTVCVSHSLRGRALDLRLISRSKAIVLGHGSSNGVDVDRFQPLTRSERVQMRSQLRIGNDTFVVGYVGRLAKDKGILDLLNAVAACSAEMDVRLVLVGSAEPDLNLERELAARPAAAAVTIWRGASAAVEREYAAFDVLALPSRREGLANALLEAQSRGLPCVTTSAVGCAEAIEPEVSGIVVPVGDPAAMARAFLRLRAEPPAELEAMGAAGRARVESHFRRETVWRQYVALYRQPDVVKATIHDSEQKV